MKKTPSLKDVAEEAGVAVTTVARAINEKGYVAEETRQRVLAAVNKTGYRVNSLARSLKSNRSLVIGHLLRSTVPNPFFLKVARGVEEESKSRGYTVLTYNVQNDAETERAGIETFLNWRADALIFSTPIVARNVEFAASQRIPVVQVERPRSAKCHRLTVRNYEGAMAAMHHLIELGHRAIAYIGQAPGSQHNELSDYVEIERFNAYRDALKAVGAFSEDRIYFGEPYQLDNATAQGLGFSATRKLLASNQRSTAILASNDILAAGALQAIYQAGLSVPQDISIVGFDDTLAEYLSPLLTSVRLPAIRLGRAAAKMAIDEIESKDPLLSEHKQLAAEFILRDSTGPIKT